MRIAKNLNPSNLWWWIKQIPSRVKNLINWHRIAWKDHQKDYSKLLEVLEFKMSLQQKYWKSKNEEKNSRYNRLCRELSRRVRKEYYLDEMLDFYVVDRLDVYLKAHERHMRKMYRKVSLGIDQMGNLSDEDKSMLAMDIASYKHRKARRLLFKILYHHIENWQ